MTTIPMSLWTETSTDSELISAVREGDSDAFGILFERHSGAAKRVAALYTRTPSDIDDVVSEAFAQVLSAFKDGHGPDLNFRAYLFTVVRRTGLAAIRRSNRVRLDDDMEKHDEAIGFEAASDEPGLLGFEASAVTDAFKSLPERWQEVLWYTEVEKKSAAEVAPMFGLSPNGVAALAFRAREALRQAYLRSHVATLEDPSCLTTVEDLPAFVRGGLGTRREGKVQAHLRKCEDCRNLVTEISDVNSGLH